MKEELFLPSRVNIKLSPGESLKIIRELQEMSQNKLSELTGIPQPTISAIEREKISIGVERAKVFARSLKVHPAVIVFPNWELEAA